MLFLKSEAQWFVKVLKSLSWASRVILGCVDTTLLDLPYFIRLFLAKVLGYGLAFLSRRWSTENRAAEYADVAVCVLLVGAQLFLQFPARFERSNTIPVTDLIIPALEAFPQDAIVISRWERFTPMLYFQQTRDLRTDVTLAVSDDYLAQIDAYYNGMPGSRILIDNQDRELTEKYRIKRFHRRWFLIVAPAEN